MCFLKCFEVFAVVCFRRFPLDLVKFEVLHSWFLYGVNVREVLLLCFSNDLHCCEVFMLGFCNDLRCFEVFGVGF